MSDASARVVRREPPRFRPVTVAAVAHRSPWLVRVTLTGPALAGFAIPQPASSVRVLLPVSGADTLEIPAWNGNEFRLADGARPVIRTLTPRRHDPANDTLDVEVVRHREGAASAWAARASEGAPAAVSGPGRGYTIDQEAPAYLVLGDESALPAIEQLLEALPPVPVAVHVEVAHPDARVELPAHPTASVTWHDRPDGIAHGATLEAAARTAEIGPGTRVWAAGEAASVQRLRTHLFGERAVPRPHTWIRGYWKHGRAGGAD